MLQTQVVEKVKHTITAFLSKTMPLWKNMEKHYRAGQATVVNMAHALCMLDK
jgi:hypothetical protein